ncbi:MAG: hypothetical protein JST28_12625 [Acidobacteria bacterium]|nr:hypothetical protein [Acidobacteriota bacterium]
MLPSELKAESFASYPPQARAIAINHLEALQKLPIAFAPSLLRELIDYDYKFPIERSKIDAELSTLNELPDGEFHEWFSDFAAISISPGLQGFNWVDLPAQFVEQEAAYLWSTHQLDAFRHAAKAYGDRLEQLTKPEPPKHGRLGIAVVGRDVPTYNAQLFRNLRKHGTYFTSIDPKDGLESLIAVVDKRAEADPTPYAHWYIDGGSSFPHSERVTCVSYEALAPIRKSLLKRMQSEIDRPGMGPEELRSVLARLAPTDLGMEATSDTVLARFQLKLFSEGSGTQIYSTTFAQWATREVLRRAQASTLLVRYAPRQRQRAMNELLAGGSSESETDPVGSLVDGEMGAYYHWINQQRLPDSDRSRFIAWFEGHRQAVAIGPTMPRGTESNSAIGLQELLALVSS